MDRAALERNLRLYTLFMAIGITPVMLPVIVLFWEENGLDMFDVYLLQAIFAIAIVALEVPTGMLADVIGKRVSLVLAMASIVGAIVVYALSHSFTGFVVAEIGLSLGLSLYSGAGSALLYDSLHALGRENEFQRLEGRARAMQMVGVALASLLGGWVGSYSLRATVWLSAVGPACGLLLALGLREVQVRERPVGFGEAIRAYRSLIADATRFVLKHRLVRWQILFLGTLVGSGSWLLWLYQPYMRLTGLPLWMFGVAFTIFNLWAALFSHLAHDIERACGRVGSVVLLIALQITPLLLMASVLGRLSFLFILMHQTVRGLAMPIVHARILRYTYADKRATVLSVASMSGRLFFGATAPLVGWVAGHTSLPRTMLWQAAGLTVLLGALLVVYRRIPAKYFAVKSEVAARQ